MFYEKISIKAKLSRDFNTLPLLEEGDTPLHLALQNRLLSGKEYPRSENRKQNIRDASKMANTKYEI